MPPANNRVFAIHVSAVLYTIGVISLGAVGCSSETTEELNAPDAKEQSRDQSFNSDQRAGEGTLTIGATSHELAIDQCDLKSTFADGDGRLYPAIHGHTAGEPFVIMMRFDESAEKKRTATLLDFSTEEPWSWITIDIDKGVQDQTGFNVTVNGNPFSLATGTDGKLVPQNGLVPVEAGDVHLQATTFARLDVSEPLEEVSLDLESRCKIHWSF